VGWKPWEFWDATAHELFQALDGFALANGSDDARTEEREANFAEFLAGMEAAGLA